MGRDMNASWVKSTALQCSFRARFDQIVSTSDPIYLREGKGKKKTVLALGPNARKYVHSITPGSPTTLSCRINAPPRL